MIIARARFDGKVFIPDEPIDLTPNEEVTLEVHSLPPEEGVGGQGHAAFGFTHCRVPVERNERGRHKSCVR
jgi:hypothetical protein